MLWLASDRRTASFQVPSSNLADLEVVSNEVAPTKFEHSPMVSAPSPEPSIIEPELELPKQPFVDPAIVNIGKPPPQSLKKMDTFATLSEPFNNLSLDPNRLGTSELETAELGTVSGIVQPPAKSRRGGRAPRRKSQQQSIGSASTRAYPEGPENVAPTGKKGHVNRVRGKKQRQSVPAEVDSLGITETVTDRKSEKTRLSQKHRTKFQENQNGWATEDATDIQELGDFDFEANLSKFDKREIFKQLKAGDTVADSARLVGHNRIPRASSARGRNLHWTENVLDTPIADNGAGWNSEAGDTAEDAYSNLMSSRKSSRRDASHSGTRAAATRKESIRTTEEKSSMRVLSQIGGLRQASFEASGSPIAKQKKTPSTSPYVGSISTPRPSLRIRGSNKLCPCLTPLQTLEFEQYAITELGLSEDILTENAARGIAETMSGTAQSDKENLGVEAVIVAAVGNHKTAARTLAACRHLRNHGFHVVASVMHLGPDEDLLEPVRRQMQAYSKAGGLLAKPNQLLDDLQSGSLHPTIFVDAMLAAHSAFEDLRRNEQAFCFELIILMNRSKVKIVSVDVPSGIDASNGQVTVAEESALAMHADVIISLGAPKPYLPAMLQQLGPNNNPEIYVADVGIGSSIWRKLGYKKHGKGVEFGPEWVVQLRYQAEIE